jgi:hypothetical protein
MSSDSVVCGENVGVCGMDGESVYGEGGEHSVAEDMTTQSIRTHHTLSPYTTSHHTTPLPHEIFPTTTAPMHYVKAIVLLPCEGVLRACGLCEVELSQP